MNAFANAANVIVGAGLEVSTTFDITWDEMPYAWKQLGGGSDATLLAYVDPLPAGNGELKAVEIVSQGDGYRYTPSFSVLGGDGFGGTVSGSIKAGKLKILEYEVQALGNHLGINDIITLTIWCLD